MALVTKEFKLDLAPGKLRPVVNASQGDIGRPFKADLYWNGSPWTATGYTAKIRGKKADNTVFEYTATVSGSSVTFSTTEQMTIIGGPVECELVFSNDGDVIASANFLLIVEASPYDPNAISESEVQGLNAMIQAATPEAVDDWFETEAPSSETFANAVNDAVNDYADTEGLNLTRGTNGVLRLGSTAATGTAGKVTGFSVFDENGNVNGVSKYDFFSLANKPENILAESSGFNVFADKTQDVTTIAAELPYRANGYGSIKLHKITGKNLIVQTAQTQTVNGVTFTVNNDGTITANGTATGYIAYFVANVVPLNKDDTYILTGCPSGGGATTYELCLSGVYAKDYGTGAVYKPASNMTCDVRIIVRSGVAINKTFSPMLRNAYKPIEGYGENILVPEFRRVTTNGLTFAENLDGTVTVNGTATAHTSFYLLTDYAFEAGKTYKLTGCPSGGNMSTYRLAINGVTAVDLGDGVVYKPTTTVSSSDVRIFILSGTACNNLVFKPVLIEESEPPYTYKKSDVTTYTIGFPSTIYGGTVDFTNGVITSKYAANGAVLATPNIYTFTAPAIDTDDFATFYTNDPVSYMGVSYIPNEKEENDELYKNYEETVVTSALSVGLPILRLFGDTSLMTKEQKVSLEWIYENAHGTCTCKWQGASSIAYEKKNYSISLSKTFDFGWGAQKKYNLKANYIDFSSSRNVCAAKLWGDIVRSRDTVPEELADLPNGGATDGFPVILEINGEFHGLYTLTIPKEPYLLGVDKSANNQAIVSAEDHSEPTKFKATITAADLAAETSFSVEYAPDEDNIEWIATGISNAITAAINCHSAEDIETLAQYIDIDSVIDHYIFAVLIGGTDITDKNYLLVTYGNDYWYMSEWDLDTTFGNHWTGGSYNGSTAYPTFSGYANDSRLMYVIYTCAKARLKARYAVLRSGALSLNNVTSKFYNFAVKIPSEVKELDTIKHPLLPGTTTNDLAQITNWYRQRLEVCDAEIDAL